MTDFTLIRLRVLNLRPSATGNRILARFDIRIAGMRVAGLALVGLADGRVVSNGITGRTHFGSEVKLRIEDADLSERIAAKALTVYREMTGGGAEWRMPGGGPGL